MLQPNSEIQSKVYMKNQLTYSIPAIIKSINENIRHMSQNGESPDSPEAQASVRPRLYSFTSVFNCKSTYANYELIPLNKRIEFVKRQQNNLYFHILQSLEPYYQKKKNKPFQPIFYNFVDMPGTRKHKVSEHKHPHIHSIIILHPKHFNAFEELRECDFLRKGGTLKSKSRPEKDTLLERLQHPPTKIQTTVPSSLQYLQSIDCQQLGKADSDLVRWTGYSAKFLHSWFADRYLDEEISSEIFDMLPLYRNL